MDAIYFNEALGVAEADLGLVALPYIAQFIAMLFAGTGADMLLKWVGHFLKCGAI